MDNTQFNGDNASIAESSYSLAKLFLAGPEPTCQFSIAALKLVGFELATWSIGALACLIYADSRGIPENDIG